jgi:hypothetical protein
MIRLIFGMILIAGAVGGMDMPGGTDTDLMLQVGMAIVGCIFIHYGFKKVMKRRDYIL